jgi:hypothetical protein
MATMSVNYNSNVSIPFSVSDTLGRLAGKRITLSFGKPLAQVLVLSKASGLGVTSADVEFAPGATASLVTGWVYLTPVDYVSLPPGDYKISLWVDDGAGFQQCVTPGGSITFTVKADVPRV